MTETSTPGFEIRSRASGSHWIAWVVRTGSEQPERSALLVGEYQDEAETKARAWLDTLR